MVLTEKQEKELELAIFEYLNIRSARFQSTIEAFRIEANINEDTAGSIGSSDSLAKKWTNIGRLQQKLLKYELTGYNGASSQQESAAIRPAKEKVVLTKMIPRPPVKNVLVGHRGAVNAVCMHPIYTILTSGGEDCTIKIWDLDLAKLERSLTGHTNQIQALAFSSDGAILASASTDSTIKLWNFETGRYECIHTLRGHDHTVSQITWLRSPETAKGEGAHLVSCGRDETIRLWNATTGYSVGVLNGHEAWVRSIDSLELGDSSNLNQDSILVSGSNDTTVRVWTITGGIKPTAKCEHILRGHTHIVECVAISSSSADKALKAKLERRNILNGSSNGEDVDMVSTDNPVTIQGIGKGGEYVVSGGRDKAIKVWSLVSGGTCVATFCDHDNWVRQIIFHPLSSYLISCSDDRTIRVFDLKTLRCVRTIEDAHSHFISSISMHNGAAYLASGAIDKSVHVWECR